MSGVELVIFDNDGVVVDSELLANRVLAELLTDAGHPTSVRDSIRDYMGGTVASVHTIIRERTGRDLPEDFDAEYHERLFAAFDAELRPVPGVEAALRALTLPYCLASSGTHDRIRRSLTITGLAGYFEGRVFSAEDVVHGKPAPDLFLHAARSLGVEPIRCVVVEDSPNGVKAGVAAGMQVLGYSALTPARALAGATATFSSMDGLSAALTGLGAPAPGSPG